MNDYMIFMHDDVLEPAIANDGARWGQYMASLRASGQFDGGSAMGPGVLIRKGAEHHAASTTLTGYLRVRAEDIDAAKKFIAGNPNYEAGGTVEIRALPRT